MINATMTRIGVALQSRFAALVENEKGATAVEYGLIVGLIAVALIGALGLMSGALQDLFGRIQTALEGA